MPFLRCIPQTVVYESSKNKELEQMQRLGYKLNWDYNRNFTATKGRKENHLEVPKFVLMGINDNDNNTK